MVNLLRSAIAFVCLSSVAAADPLPALNLEPEAATVSGLSSGAFMAVQLQVAFFGRDLGRGHRRWWAHMTARITRFGVRFTCA